MTYPRVALHTDPGRIRPGRVWYVIASLITLALVIGGPVTSQRLAQAAVPQIRAAFGPAVWTTVDLPAEKNWAIYLAAPDAGAQPVPSTCEHRALDEGTMRFIKPWGYDVSFARDGRMWRLFMQIEVGRSGRFDIACTPEADGQQIYGIAENPFFTGYFRKVAAGPGTMFGVPLLGLLIGGTVTMIVALRRRSNRRARQQRLAGYRPPAGVLPPGYRTR